MTGDDWTIRKDFDELRRDMNELFTKRYSPFVMLPGVGGFLTAEDIRRKNNDTGRMEKQ